MIPVYTAELAYFQWHHHITKDMSQPSWHRSNQQSSAINPTPMSSSSWHRNDEAASPMAVSNSPAQFSWPHGHYTVIGMGNMVPEEWYNMANESQRHHKLAGKHSLSTCNCSLKHIHIINTIHSCLHAQCHVTVSVPNTCHTPQTISHTSVIWHQWLA